jgi:hypothetical protein
VTRALWGVALFALAGCSPTLVEFENQLPGTAIENVRWVSSRTDTSYSPDEPNRLEPGERSSEVQIWEDDEGARGHVYFEIVVGDTRVALVTDREYRAHFAETSMFTIGRDTRVSNLLWDEIEGE